MRTIAVTDGIKGLVPCRSSGSLKLLYMTHLALGDYLYQGPFLKALALSQPSIQLDIWIDDCRQKKKSWHTGRSQSLVQWLSNESHINSVYPIASHTSDLNQQIEQAHFEDYDAIVFVATNRNAEFATTALKIVNRGKVFGTLPANKLDRLMGHSVYKKLDGKINLTKSSQYDHISDFYQDIFRQLFAINLHQKQRLLKLNISDQLKDQCVQKIDSLTKKYQLTQPQVIFINHLSTSQKRDWKRSQIDELIQLISNKSPQCLFILNSPPNEFEALDYWVKNNSNLSHLAIEVFTAKNDFFELPSLMSLCNLVISVETATMHLASNLNIKQVALIRQSAKHWRPLNNSLVLQGEQRVDSIQPTEVFDAISNF